MPPLHKIFVPLHKIFARQCPDMRFSHWFLSCLLKADVSLCSGGCVKIWGDLFLFFFSPQSSFPVAPWPLCLLIGSASAADSQAPLFPSVLSSDLMNTFQNHFFLSPPPSCQLPPPECASECELNSHPQALIALISPQLEMIWTSFILNKILFSFLLFPLLPLPVWFGSLG